MPILFKTRQIFCCTCFNRTFFLLRKISHSFSSQLTFRKHSTNANKTSAICKSTINGRLSTPQRIIRKEPVLTICRLYIFSNRSCFQNLSSIQNASNVRRIQLGNVHICSGSFHSTLPRYVHPLLWMVVKPMAKLIALFGGRRFRFWYQTLPLKQKKMMLSWQKILMMLAILVGLGMFYYISHLQETPITKRIRFIAFTDEQFMKIANFEAKLQENMKENLFLPATHPSYIRVIQIMECLVHRNWALSNMKTQKWKVAILDSFDINAYVLASGHVFVNVGLLNFVQNDDQLAFVLAHEIAHILLGHAAEKVSFTQMIDYFVIIVMAAIWAFMPFDGIALVTQVFYEKVVQILLNSPYSRKLEREADIVGLELAAKACFDVREGSNFWKLMQFHEKLKGTETPEWISTHPSNVKRLELIEHFIPKAISIREQYHCNPLSENDPRDCLKDMKKLCKTY